MDFSNFFEVDGIDAEKLFGNTLDMLTTLKEDYTARWKEWEQAQIDGDFDAEINIGEGASTLVERHLGALLAVNLIAMQLGYIIKETDGKFVLEKLPDDTDERMAAVAGQLMQSSMFTGYPRELRKKVIPELIEHMNGTAADE